MSRRPRGLRPEEHELWQRVAETLRPHHPHPHRRAEPAEPPATETALPPAAPHPARLSPFRLGETAPPRPLHHDLAPPLPERLAQAPVAMDRKTHRRMTRGELEPEGRIDLHGMTLAEAHPALTGFILSRQAAGARLVLVITGKGRDRGDHGPIPQRGGLLRAQVPHWLSLPPLRPHVLQVTEAHRRHGGAGAYYVYLRRGR